MEFALDRSTNLTSGTIYEVARLAHKNAVVDIPMSAIAGSIQNTREMNDADSKNRIMKVFSRYERWDESFFCFLIRKASKNVYFVIRGFPPYVAALELGLNIAKAKVVGLDLDDLSDDGICLLSLYLRKTDINSFFYQTEETVVGQLYTLSILLREYLPTSTKNLNNKFGPQELLNLYPEEMRESKTKTFVASMDLKKNRGALRLIRLNLAEKLYIAESSSLDPKLGLLALRNLSSPKWTDTMIIHAVNEFLENGKPLNNFSIRKFSSFTKKVSDADIPKCYVEVSENRSAKTDMDHSRGETSKTNDDNSNSQIVEPETRPSKDEMPKSRTEDEEKSANGQCSSPDTRRPLPENSEEKNEKTREYEKKPLELFTEEDGMHVNSAFPIYFNYRTYKGMVNSESFGHAMQNGSMIYDDLILFGAQCILEDMRSISFCPDICRRSNLIIYNPERHFEKIYDKDTEYIAVLVDNALHFSLVLCFGFREAVDWILSPVPDSYCLYCPMMIIHLDSFPAQNHYDLVQKHIVPWFKQLLQYEAKRTNREILVDYDSLHNAECSETEDFEEAFSRQSFRYTQALRVFCVKSVPIQPANSNECGWNVLRYMMLLKDFVLNKELFISACRDTEVEVVRRTVASPVTYVLKSNEMMDRAFRCISIGQVRQFIRYELVKRTSSLSGLKHYNYMINSWEGEKEKIMRKENELKADEQNIRKRSVLRLRPKRSYPSKYSVFEIDDDLSEIRTKWRRLAKAIEDVQKMKDPMKFSYLSEDVESYFSHISKAEKVVSSFLQDC